MMTGMHTKEEKGPQKYDGLFCIGDLYGKPYSMTGIRPQTRPVVPQRVLFIHIAITLHLGIVILFVSGFRRFSYFIFCFLLLPLRDLQGTRNREGNRHSRL